MGGEASVGCARLDFGMKYHANAACCVDLLLAQVSTVQYSPVQSNPVQYSPVKYQANAACCVDLLLAQSAEGPLLTGPIAIVKLRLRADILRDWFALREYPPSPHVIGSLGTAGRVR
eukprot:5198003-Pyramimonas_sp.AAC.1